ncbi:MAG: hypothetical protein LBP53_04115 [Candidatus Peribacteria bacterium]|nr:hypothetical protein [Candidatus Peribacteria bacterium]
MVLPRLFSFPEQTFFFDMEQFQQHKTSSGDLNALIDNLIKRPLALSPTLPVSPVLSLKEGIIMDFNLGCLLKIKVSDTICNIFLERFYQQGMFYPLANYANDMQILMQKLKDTTKLCKLMYDTTLYQKKVFPLFDTLVSQCLTEQIQQYRTLTNFIQVENELTNSILSSTVYPSATINAYKLLSFQQILYKSLLAGTFNKSYLTNYLEYSQELINRNQINDRYLAPLYKDILYQVNATLLLPKLENHDNKILSKAEVNQMVNQITLLNKGNTALGVVGLEKQLTTPHLIQQRTISEVETTTKDIEELFKSLLALTNNLKVQNYVISSGRDEIFFQTEIFSQKIEAALEDTLKAKITLFRQYENLYIKDIVLVNEPNLTLFLESYLKDTFTSFMQLLNIIDENVLFYHEPLQENQQDFCETVSSKIGEYVNILSCTDTVLDVFKEGINYMFTLRNAVITDITVSDKALEEQIKTTLQDTFLNATTTLLLLQEILIPKSTPTEVQYVEERLRINERMKTYLNTIPIITDIDADTFEVVFKVGEFTLKGIYTLSTHTISKIYYVISDESTLLIRDFVIPLLEEEKEDLAYFSNNPRVYLKLFNTAAFDKYERMLEAQ